MRQIRNDTKTALLTAVFFSALILTGNSATAQKLSLLDREISEIISRVSGAVVKVDARVRVHESKAPLFPGQESRFARPVNTVVGTGLMIDSLGHILTVLSLVDGYDDFRVEVTGRSHNAELIGVDRQHNLAVLKIKAGNYPFLELSLFPPVAGRLVIAYGLAIGGTGYPALGIIAGRLGDGSYLVSGSVLPGLLGGGVFDFSGGLIGIISSGSVSESNHEGNLWGGIVMLPSYVAYAAADRIICCGNHDAGYLGIRTTAIELVSREGKVIGEAVAVSHVDPYSPAASAGIRTGDIITRFANQSITSDRDLQRLVNSAGSDSIVTVELLRSHKNSTVKVTLSSIPQSREISRAYQASLTPDRGGLSAYELQRRIDSMHAEVRRMQKEIDRLLSLIKSTR